MLDISASVPTSNRPAGIATRMPATHVANAGVRKRGCTWLNASGSRRSRAHGKPDARLPILADQDGRDHPHHRAEQHEQPHPVQAVSAGRQRDRLSALTTGAPSPATDCHGTMPVSTSRDADVQDGADHQRRDDADGHIALRIAALLAGRGDGVEADVGEER